MHVLTRQNQKFFNLKFLFSFRRVEIVDVPEGHELAGEDDGTNGFLEAAERFVAQGHLSDSVSTIQEAAKMNANYIKKKIFF